MFPREYSRDSSLCGNAQVKGAKDSETLPKGVLIEDFEDSGRLCPSYVMTAYKLGIIKVEEI